MEAARSARGTQGTPLAEFTGEARKQRQWNATYCNHESWRDAIDNGWSIISALTFRTGEQVWFVAECN